MYFLLSMKEMNLKLRWYQHVYSLVEGGGDVVQDPLIPHLARQPTAALARDLIHREIDISNT